MRITARELCELLNGELEGDPDVIITGPSKIEESKEGSICFLASAKYESYLYKSKAAVVLVGKDFQPKEKISPSLIRVDNVYISLGILLHQFDQKLTQKGIAQNATIAENVEIGKGSSIGAYTVVEEDVIIGENCIICPQVYIARGCEIGTNTVLYPGVKIYRSCIIGENCIIHANTVIGSDGFGFVPKKGVFEKIPQVGNVVIEDNVEIGANTVIDRATMGSTVIEKGAKLDNLIQIAHNVSIGKNTVIAAQAGIAGSTNIGENCMIGGQSGFVGHIKIADNVKVQAQSGVSASIKKEGQAVYGSPALPYREYLKAYTIFKKLPQLEKRVQELEINKEDCRDK